MHKSQKALTRRSGRVQTNIRWSEIDCDKAERKVNKLQSKIAKVVENGRWNLAKKLQHLLTNSLYALYIAVKKVSKNKGKNTPGVDGKLLKTLKEKDEVINEIRSKKYKSSPLRRIYIPKKNGKKRPLGIPTMKDRVMQAIYHMALDPISEVTADKTSFGFRKERGCHDALAYLFNTLARKTSATKILECDIKGCFDNISHKWNLENIPMDKKILKEFLKSGYIFEGEIYKTETGTPQGGIISPTLANITLDGMEGILQKEYWTNMKGTVDRQHNKKKVYLTRYADDFVVTATTEETLLEIKERIRVFLKERGLEFSEEKTQIVDINDGFDLLGWNFRKYKNKLLIKPSEKSIANIVEKLKRIIKEMRNSKQSELIDRLNPIITGWCNYHRVVCSKKTFQDIDSIIFESLWKWAKGRHQTKSREWIKEKYWIREGQRDWIFSDKKKKLKFAADTKIIRHTLVKLEANPYLPKYREYYEKRQREKIVKAVKARIG